jgi:hypothetical protein
LGSPRLTLPARKCAPRPQERRAKGIEPEANDILSHMLRAQAAGDARASDRQLRDELQVGAGGATARGDRRTPRRAALQHRPCFSNLSAVRLYAC